jgi:acetylornithine deacetylase/succinyl-diaminopimelate desuccinylase-like protein
MWIEPEPGAVTELLVALIQDACVNDGTADSGHEERAAATIEAYLGESGQAFEPHPGRRSLLYRIPGTDPTAPSIMLMGHTDVVPVSVDGWSVDPFSGERSGGFVWGRGAVDMLNLTAAMAVVFKQHLTGTAPRLRGDLLYLAVADEEAAGVHGAQWLINHEWDSGLNGSSTTNGIPSIATTS